MRTFVLVCLLLSVSCKQKESTHQHLMIAPPSRPNSWGVPNWYFDPANITGCASDNNGCTSSTCASGGVGPCLTHGQILIRLETSNPLFSVSVTETQLSDQASPWADPIILRPDIIQPSGKFTFVGSLLQQTTTTINTFTPRVRASGTTNHITAVGQSGSYWSTYVGDIVNDTTSSAWFWVEKDLGSGVAQITEPLQSTTSNPFPPMYVTIANGDSLVISRPVYSNIVALQAGALEPLTVEHVTFVGGYAPSFGYRPTLIECAFGYSASHSGLFESAVTSQNVFYSQYSSYVGNSITFGGAVASPSAVMGSVGVIGQNSFDADVLIDTGTEVHVPGPISFGRVYVGSVLDTDNNGTSLFVGTYDTNGLYYADGEVWGPVGLDLHDRTTFVCYGGCTSQLLLTGALTLHGGSTGFPWVSGSHGYGAAVSITPAAIDANNGLFDPRTGDGFMNHP